MIWNPWKRIRELDTEIAILLDRQDQMAERLDSAERDAMYRACDHYAMRTKHIQLEKQRMMEVMANISSMTPRSIIVDESMLGPLKTFERKES
jgi:hypothetical protein